MDTESGRVYLPDEYAQRTKGEIEDEHQAHFMARLAEGKIVEVSDRVAIAQLTAQEREARKRLRKAQKAARKKNRG